ncbi:hypothetical protein MMC15_000590 [Xylographa vitiligo]|nr:hypothetical protein [Xylographa vitiligo]
MGATISAMLDAKKRADETKAIHDLEMLQKLVDSQLDKYEAELDAQLLDPNATAGTEVHDLWQDLSTQSSTGGALKPAKEVNSTIDKFFAADSGDDKTMENLLPGFKSLVNGALDQFLGDITIGEKSQSKYFIFIGHHEVVRVDVKVSYDQSVLVAVCLLTAILSSYGNRILGTKIYTRAL